jgi:geranylgeranyl diphosphate synthase type I
LSTNETVAAHDAPQVLRAAQDAIEPLLRESVGRLSAPLRKVISYHFGWCDECGDPTSGNGGKAVRPALVLSAASAVGGIPEQALDAAVAVELVHNSSLVHDDIIDGDVTRRHRGTVWSVFGVPAAILAGDAMLALAGQVLAASANRAATCAWSILAGSVQDLLSGQLADVALESRGDVRVDECVAMAADKTAALMGSACALGASFAGADPATVISLRLFGQHLGMTFQFVDDLLGIWGDPDITGKPALSDLRTRKKSLPVAGALVADTAPSRRLRDLYLRKKSLTDAELTTVADLVAEAGGKAWAQAEAESHLSQALSYLRAVGSDPALANDLVMIAHMIARRDY